MNCNVNSLIQDMNSGCCDEYQAYLQLLDNDSPCRTGLALRIRKGGFSAWMTVDNTDELNERRIIPDSSPS